MFLGLILLFRYFIKDYTDKRISIKEESEKEMFNKTEEMNQKKEFILKTDMIFGIILLDDKNKVEELEKEMLGVLIKRFKYELMRKKV